MLHGLGRREMARAYAKSETSMYIIALCLLCCPARNLASTARYINSSERGGIVAWRRI